MSLYAQYDEAIAAGERQAATVAATQNRLETAATQLRDQAQQRAAADVAALEALSRQLRETKRSLVDLRGSLPASTRSTAPSTSDPADLASQLLDRAKLAVRDVAEVASSIGRQRARVADALARDRSAAAEQERARARAQEEARALAAAGTKTLLILVAISAAVAFAAVAVARTPAGLLAAPVLAGLCATYVRSRPTTLPGWLHERRTGNVADPLATGPNGAATQLGFVGSASALLLAAGLGGLAVSDPVSGFAGLAAGAAAGAAVLASARPIKSKEHPAT